MTGIDSSAIARIRTTRAAGAGTSTPGASLCYIDCEFHEAGVAREVLAVTRQAPIAG